jgi:hypothetical protein
MGSRCAVPGPQAPWRAFSLSLVALTAAFAAMTSSVAAQTRPSTVNMTCAQARALVGAHGAIVLGTGRYTYDRFVTHGGFCLNREATRAAWVPTFDTPQCFVGYTCIEAELLDR